MWQQSVQVGSKHREAVCQGAAAKADSQDAMQPSGCLRRGGTTQGKVETTALPTAPMTATAHAVSNGSQHAGNPRPQETEHHAAMLGHGHRTRRSQTKKTLACSPGAPALPRAPRSAPAPAAPAPPPQRPLPRQRRRRRRAPLRPLPPLAPASGSLPAAAPTVARLPGWLPAGAGRGRGPRRPKSRDKTSSPNVSGARGGEAWGTCWSAETLGP